MRKSKLLLWTIVAQLTPAVFASYRCNGPICFRNFQLTNENRAISDDPGTTRAAIDTDAGCAVRCLDSRTCHTYSVAATLDGVDCRMTASEDPGLLLQLGARVFKVSNWNGTRGDNEPADNLTTVAMETTTSTPAPCTNPTLTVNRFECDGRDTFNAASIVKLGSNRALVFRGNNKCYYCDSMNNIVQQGAQSCNGPHFVTGDTGLDPDNSRFLDDPPYGGVGFITSNMADCRYFLFEGENVYCYMHWDSYTAKMKPCTDWTHQNIQSRFGLGIPSHFDDVIGNFDSSYDFYFVKNNEVYLSTGNASSGSLADGYPKPIHMEFPNVMCDVTAVTEGMTRGEVYSVVGHDVYRGMDHAVYDKGTLCHN